MTEYSHPDIEEARRLAETGSDLMPRYSMKRMRDELRRAEEFARREALEEAAAYHDDLAAQHDAVAYESDHHELMVKEHRRFAAAIRSLANSSPRTNNGIDRREFVKGKLDEIVSTKGAHLEYMGGSRWFLSFQHEDGTETALWFSSRDLRNPSWEIRAAVSLSDSTPTLLQEQNANAASVENSGGKRGEI